MTLEQYIESIVRRIAGEVALEIVRAEMTRAHGERHLKTAEACEVLGVGETTLRQLVRIGVLKQVRVGKRGVRYPRSAVGVAMDELARRDRSAVESAQAAARRLAGVRRG